MNEDCKPEGDELPQISVVRYEIVVPRDCGINEEHLNQFVEDTKLRTSTVLDLWRIDCEKLKRLMDEGKELTRRLNTLEQEAIKIKRTRWCIICEKEATIINEERFYCSKECQEVGQTSNNN